MNATEATRAGFIEDIVANRADDTPRLIFADWLDDHGDEDHALFIRLQVEAAATGQTDCQRKMPEIGVVPGGSSQIRMLRCGCCKFCLPHMAAELLHQVQGAAFIGEMPFSYAHDCNHYSLHKDFARDHPSLYLWRGFVAVVRVSCQAWLDHGRELVKAHPIERVELIDVRVTNVCENWRGEKFALPFWAGLPKRPAGRPWPWEFNPTVSTWAETEEAAKAARGIQALEWARTPEVKTLRAGREEN